MGKATQRRKAYQKKILVRLSYNNPELFAAQWDMRLESWLADARILAAHWRRGVESRRCVFEVLENALDILNGCEPGVAALVLRRTYNEISHVCSVAVSEVLDSRLYHLSNTGDIIQHGKENKYGR